MICKETKKVSIVTEERFESNDVIQEFMLLAGEGAAKFAFKNKIPFPYVSQESDNLFLNRHRILKSQLFYCFEYRG